MSDKICETLNLPTMAEVLGDQPDDNNTGIDNLVNALGNTSMGELQMADEEGVLEHAEEMNEIYEEAMQGYRDLMDLAMNMEAKNAGTVAEPAATFLKIALDASKNKTDSKFKKLRLKLDVEKFNLAKEKEKGKSEIIDVTEETFEANRNDLIKILQSKKNATRDK